MGGSVFFGNGATFKRGINLMGANIGAALEMHGSIFQGLVDLIGCRVTGDFLLGFSEHSTAQWEVGASLRLCNTHVGALQDWWRDDRANSWPETYELEGFTYERIGSIGTGEESDMLKRPVTSYKQWLSGDPGSSPQPYEHLADRFHESGEPHKAADIRYAARERRRHRAWSRGDWLHSLGLWALRETIGYGLGNGYFNILRWVLAITFLGALILSVGEPHPVANWLEIGFASLDHLLPIVTLSTTHDELIFNSSQPDWVVYYFHVHKIVGWILSSLLVAGLAGLTQRN